jgi:hypothetical protein
VFDFGFKHGGNDEYEEVKPSTDFDDWVRVGEIFAGIRKRILQTISKDQSEKLFTDIRTELEGLAKNAEGYKTPPKKKFAFN